MPRPSIRVSSRTVRALHGPSCLAAILLAGCAGTTPPSLPALPQLTASLGADRLAIAPSADPPAEVYSRIARGALRCWFGPEGSLKKTHIFQARVDPPASGGSAEIVVQTRDAENPVYGSLRAYSIDIVPSGGGSLVETRNGRFPEQQANAMMDDVARWSGGKEGCSMVGTGGWTPGQPPATPEAPAAKTEKKPKPAPSKSQIKA